MTFARSFHLLTLDVNGRTFRFTDASERVTATNSGGVSHTFEPGLDPLVTSSGVLSSVGVRVAAGAVAGVSWARLVARGHHLERARATLQRWRTGETLDRARVLIAGHLTGVSYGSAFEPLTGTIERLLTESGTVPPRAWVIDDTTWPVTALHTVDPAVVGAQGAMVLGTPIGAIVPAYMADFRASTPGTCKVVFAYHRVEATSVTLHDVDGEWSATRTVKEVQDNLGRVVSYVDFDGLAYAPEEGREYRIAFDQAAGAGLLSGGVGLTGAGEIIEYLLRFHADAVIDWARLSAQIPALNAYKLGVVLTEPRATWDVVRGIVDLLPFEWAESEAGLYLAPWNLDTTAGRSRGHVDCSPGGGIERATPVQMLGGSVFNRFAISYRPDGRNLKPSLTALLGPEPAPGEAATLTDARYRRDLRCTVSRGLYGDRPMAPASTEIVHETATAQLILGSWALRSALPRRGFEIVGGLELDRFEAEDSITVTASDIEITAEPAIIKAKAIDGDRVRLTLVLADNPAARTRPTTA
jgi:hypothetical protein